MVGDADERLEEGDRTGRVLFGQVLLVVHVLQHITVLIEGHHCYTIVLADLDLDVHPLVNGQEDSL